MNAEREILDEKSYFISVSYKVKRLKKLRTLKVNERNMSLIHWRSTAGALMRSLLLRFHLDQGRNTELGKVPTIIRIYQKFRKKKTNNYTKFQKFIFILYIFYKI